MVRFDDIYLYIILFFKIFLLIMLFSQLFYIFLKGKMTIGNSEELFLFFVFLVFKLNGNSEELYMIDCNLDGMNFLFYFF